MAGALRGRQQSWQISHSHPCSCFWGAEAALLGQGSCPLDDRNAISFLSAPGKCSGKLYLQFQPEWLRFGLFHTWRPDPFTAGDSVAVRIPDQWAPGMGPAPQPRCCSLSCCKTGGLWSPCPTLPHVETPGVARPASPFTTGAYSTGCPGAVGGTLTGGHFQHGQQNPGLQGSAVSQATRLPAGLWLR